jgi:hypothetical protein
MDEKKVKENYEMIKAAVKNKIVLGPEKMEELTEYFNHIVVTTIANKQYKPVIEYDIDEYDNDDNEDENLVISVNIPKHNIDTIVGASTISETLEDIEYLVGRQLGRMYRSISDAEDDLGLLFDVDMEIAGENTIHVEITIDEVPKGNYDNIDDDDDDEEVTQEEIEDDLKEISKVLPHETFQKFADITHKIMDEKK